MAARGVNTYTTLGTEEDDAFVLTQEGLRGAGLNTRYQNIQRVNLDARGATTTFMCCPRAAT